MTRILLAAFVAAALPLGATQAGDTTTLENLQAAYNGESNAAARYRAWAARADAEGYLAVGRLFRAASRAEEIHARNHAKVIQALGGTPRANLAKPAVKATAENLKAALGGESYERDTMYPEFLARAREEGNADAVRTLDLARNAEIEHAKLYEAALADLPGRKALGEPLHVCRVCGFTAPALPKDGCPSSSSPLEEFERVD